MYIFYFEYKACRTVVSCNGYIKPQASYSNTLQIDSSSADSVNMKGYIEVMLVKI